MRDAASLLLLALATISSTSSTALSAAVVLARSGDTINDRATLQFVRPPTISANGTIAFSTKLDAGSSALVVIKVDGARQLLIDRDPVQGLSDATWSSYQNTSPTVLDNGNVFWTVHFRGNGLPITGATGAIGGPLETPRVLFPAETSANNLPPGWRLRFPALARVRQGSPALIVASAFAPTDGPEVAALVQEASPIPNVLALATNAAPGLPAGETMGRILGVSMNDHGAAIVTSEAGMWRVEGGQLHPIIVRNADNELVPDAEFIGDFGVAQINSAGQMVGYGRISDQDQIVFTGVPGDLREVVRLYDLPVLPNGEMPDTLFEGPIINARGTVAFVLNTGPSNTFRSSGVYVARNNVLTRIVAVGEPVPGYPQGWTFSEASFHRLQLNATDQMIFPATLRPPSGSTRVRSLWAWAPGHGLQLITAADRALQLTTGETVQSEFVAHAFDPGIWSESSGGQDGAMRLLGDNGQVVFAITENPNRQFVVAVTLPGIGDINADGLLNGADLSVLLAQYANTVKPGDSGDFNLDGLVNASDLSVLLSAIVSQN